MRARRPASGTEHPSPEEVAELERLLSGHGKEHEFHGHDGAGHAFLCTDRPAYRAEAALDGYRRIASSSPATSADRRPLQLLY